MTTGNIVSLAVARIIFPGIRGRGSELFPGLVSYEGPGRRFFSQVTTFRQKSNYGSSTSLACLCVVVAFSALYLDEKESKM